MHIDVTYRWSMLVTHMSGMLAGMTRTMIDLDGDLLDKAAQELGTETKKDTVHAALRAALRDSAARNLRAMMVADPDGPAHEAAVNAMWEHPEQARTA